jgi:hypothetical protein
MNKPQPFIGAIAGAVLLPIAKEFIKAGVGAAVQRASEKAGVPLTAAAAPKVAVAVANEMAKDPVMVNAMNAEPLTQSRVMWGSIIAAISVVVPPIAGMFGFNIKGSAIMEFGQALITLGGVGYAIYGRLAKNLPPLWNKD